MPNNLVAAIVVGGTLLASTLFTGCSGPEAAKPPAGPPEVQVAPVARQDVTITKEWVGTLDGSNNANVQARVSGYIVSQNYKEGTGLKKGDLLFQIDPRPFEVALAMAKANLAKSEADQRKAELDEKRNVELFAQRAVAQQDRDNAVLANAAAKADILVQKAAVAQAELNLEYTKIIAPVDGIAGIANVNVGDLVGSGTGNLTTISTVDPIKAYCSWSEQEYMKAAPRLQELESTPEEKREADIVMILADGTVDPHKGKFNFAARQVDGQTGTIRISALFPNPDHLRRPGQFARMQFPMGTKKEALLVPQRAVSELQGANQVAVVGPDNKVSIRNVKVGEQVGAMSVIDDGLKPGERVVVEGTQKVRDGMTVAPKPWTPLPEKGSDPKPEAKPSEPHS